MIRIWTPEEVSAFEALAKTDVPTSKAVDIINAISGGQRTRKIIRERLLRVRKQNGRASLAKPKREDKSLVPLDENKLYWSKARAADELVQMALAQHHPERMVLVAVEPAPAVAPEPTPEPEPAVKTPDKKAQIERDWTAIQSNNRFDTIIRAVCVCFGVGKGDLISKDNHVTLVRPRQIAMWLARRLTNASFEVLGRKFKRDHSTVVHSCDRIETLRKSDAAVADALSTILTQLNTEARRRNDAAMDEKTSVLIMQIMAEKAGRVVVAEATEATHEMA